MYWRCDVTKCYAAEPCGLPNIEQLFLSRMFRCNFICPHMYVFEKTLAADCKFVLEQQVYAVLGPPRSRLYALQTLYKLVVIIE